MTDKVQKIREEVERLYNQSLADEKRQVERGLECSANVSYGKSKACKELLSFINSMQEEPKECMYSKDNYTDEDRKALCDGCEEDCKYAKLNTILDYALTKETKESWNERLDKKDYRERYKRIAQSESFKKTHEGMSIGDTVTVEGEISEEPTIPDIVDEHFDEMLGEEPVSKVWHDSNLEQPNPKKITLGIFKDKTCPVVGYNSWYDENSIWAYLDDLLNLTHSVTKISNQEPVSEDLEKAGKEWLRPQLDKSYANYGEAMMMELTHFDGYAMLDAVGFGANWQKEQMMAKAVDGEVGYWNLRGLSVKIDLPRSVSEGDKVKIIVIKGG